MTDARFSNTPLIQANGPLVQADNRQSRESQDRPQTENREITDEVRLEQYRMNLYNNSLPDLPKIPGYHVCWLTTTNPRDTVEGRQALGYQLVKPSDFPGNAFVASIKGGVWDGFVGYQEMIAAKIPEDLYQMYMRESHFDAPNREEEKLMATVNQIQQMARGYGAEVKVGDGIADIRDRLKESHFKKPHFS